jgi:ribonuclease P protein component
VAAAQLSLHVAPRAANAWLSKPGPVLASWFLALSLACVQRLQTRPQFQAVLAGAIVARSVHFALHRNSLDAKAPAVAGKISDGPSLFPVQDMWIGAMVPKRWARRAVTRNAIKRQIYTVSADFLHQYPQAAFVVRLRREFSRKEFISATSEQLKQAVRSEVLSLMQAGALSAVPA